MDTPPDLFAGLNDAFAGDPVSSRAADVVVEQPLVVVHFVDAEGSLPFPGSSCGRGDSRVSFVEAFMSADVAALWHRDRGRRRQRPGSTTSLQDLGPQVWQIATLVAEVGQDATLTAAVGRPRRRLRPPAHRLPPGRPGCHRQPAAVYFGDGDQMLDFRTFQDHRAPDTTSNLLFKGAVGGRAASVYTGLIRVEQGGPGHQRLPDEPQHQAVRRRLGRVGAEPRDREQRRALLATPRPSGPIDEEQRFYLESRGVPPTVAERLIVAGFFDEVIDAAARRRLVAAGARGRDRGQARRARGASADDGDATASAALDDLRRRRGPPLRRRRPPIARRAHRRRRLRHRRPLQPRRRVAGRGRGRRRRAARSSAGSTARVLPRDRRAACRCRHPAGAVYEVSVDDGDVFVDASTADAATRPT